MISNKTKNAAVFVAEASFYKPVSLSFLDRARYPFSPSTIRNEKTKVEAAAAAAAARY